MQKQLQLFSLISYLPKNRCYALELDGGKFGKVFVDKNDKIIKTVGFGRTSKNGNHWDRSSASNGKEFCELWSMNRNNTYKKHIEALKSNLPVVHKDHPVYKKIQQFTQKKSVLHWDSFLANMKSQGWSSKIVDGGNAVYHWTFYKSSH